MIQVKTLSNGIRVITDANPLSESVSLGVWVGVGARFETPDINGISHVLEHMAFKGTEKRTAFDISREIEDVGGVMNAYTGKDMTAYYVKAFFSYIFLVGRIQPETAAECRARQSCEQVAEVVIFLFVRRLGVVKLVVCKKIALDGCVMLVCMFHVKAVFPLATNKFSVFPAKTSI